LLQFRNLLFVSIFITILFVSGAWTLLSEDHKRSVIENRTLAQMPNTNLQNLLNGKYAKDFENYLKDQFFAREFWLQYLFKLQAGLGFSDIKGIVKGKDDYLLETLVYSDKNISNINHNVKKLEQLKRIIGSDRLYIAVAPRQTQANQDKLPLYVENNADEYTDLFFSKLSADIKKIDLRDVIYKKNKENDLYFKTDHHWNMHGTYLAYKEILSFIRRTHPEVPVPYEKSDYTIKLGSDEFYGSLARRSRNVFDVPPDRIELWYPKNHENTLITVGGKKSDTYFNNKILKGTKYENKYNAYWGAGSSETVYTVPQNNELPNILIIGDSYSLSFTSLISQHFFHTHLLYLRNANSSINISKIIEDNKISMVLVLVNSNFVINEKFNNFK